MDKNDLDAVRARIAELQQAANQMYQAQAQAQANASTNNAGGNASADNGNDPHVVDATFEEKKDDNK